MRRLLTPIGLALLAVAGSMPLFAQDPAPSRADADKPGAAAPAPRRSYDPSRRVPNHFGQVGLTVEQREAIYKIRKGHQEKLDALRAEIAAIEAKSLGECEAVLTDTQRKLLENLRGGTPPASAKTADASKPAK
jgi:hypothetical protein